MRVMLLGCEGTGKTSFVKRLIGSVSSSENKKFTKEVLIEKKEGENTQCYDLFTYEEPNKKYKISIWDFSGKLFSFIQFLNNFVYFNFINFCINFYFLLFLFYFLF